MSITDLIIAVSTVCYVVFTGFILIANQKAAKTANKQLQISQVNLKPQLSMNLNEVNGFLLLTVTNNGQTPAKEVWINIVSLVNNGDNELIDGQFTQRFELYPSEAVQRRIAIYGANLETGFVYPTLTLEVSYLITNTKERISYSRTVTYSTYYDKRVYADINIDKQKLEASIHATTRAILRIANYLDGCQLSSFDEKDILPDRSLQNDLSKSIHTNELSPVIKRTTLLHGNKTKGI